MSKKKRIIFLSLAITILAVGYAIGAYFVDYALKRGNDTDPLAPPAACVSIHDKTREVPALPKAKSEPWHNVSADGRNLAATHFFRKNRGSAGPFSGMVMAGTSVMPEIMPRLIWQGAIRC